MVIALYSYHARTSAEKSPPHLYREWRRILSRSNVIATELFASVQDPAEMIMMARFPDEESVWAAVESDEYRAWYSQLARFMEEGPSVSHYRSVDCEG
jgi:quinol monooxygenase YgiN